MKDRETEREAPKASKWRKLKTSLFGEKPTPIEERIMRLPPQAPEEPAPAPEPPLAEEAKREPEPTEDTPTAAPSISQEPPAEEKKGSRKKKGEGRSQKRQRNRKVFVIVDEAEHAAIAESAARAGLSVSAYSRACLLGDAGPRAKRAPPLNRVIFGDAIAALNRVGNNLNQIAHNLNAGGHPDHERIAESNGKLDDCLSAILKALGRTE